MNLGRLARAALNSASGSGRGGAGTSLSALYANTPALLFSRGARVWHPDPAYLESLEGPVLHNNGGCLSPWRIYRPALQFFVQI